MSSKSNNQGRAYEFSYLITLFEEISKVRVVRIVENSSYFAAERAWDTLTDSEKTMYKISSLAGVNTLFDLEPLIRRGIEWEIGLSVKHNHFAVKHSRLSKNLDFGNKWYGINCSDQYWEDIKPIFEYLDIEKKKDRKWSELPNKEDDVYVPLLNAFKNELEKQNKLNGNEIPKLII